ncbi:uncharacterized protein VTP21DRAFT_8212 [Calcarisporiella thermophila]|uniref:uncharacterized protein n=1 Tax=Calcarisporiella thermophila TaxID=911321 RepID=UPI0037430189
MGCCLGGTANETDPSARICAHIGLATNPDFMLSKPGLGGDEGVMILKNEIRGKKSKKNLIFVSQKFSGNISILGNTIGSSSQPGYYHS